MAGKAKDKWEENHVKALRGLGITTSLRTLRMLENIANHNAVLYCNGDIDGEEYEKRKDQLVARFTRIVGFTPDGFFVNSDPRGYALKIDNEKTTIPAGLHADWGGYGILAPDFN